MPLKASLLPCARALPAFLIAACVCGLGSTVAFCQDKPQLPSDPQQRIYEIYDVLTNIPNSEERLLALLADDDAEVRRTTLEKLSRIDSMSSRVQNSVTRLVSSPDERTRLAAIRCLGLGQISEPSEIDAIKGALSDSVPAVRLAAVEVTSKVDVTKKCLITNLLASSNDKETAVQLGAVKTLKNVKCDQSAAVPILARLSETSLSAEIRTAAIRSLADLEANIDSTIELLRRLALQDKDADVRYEAVRSLQTVGSLTSQQITDLSRSTRDPSLRVREVLAYTMVKLGQNSPQALAALSTLQDDGDEGVRESVAWAERDGHPEKPIFQLVAKSLRDRSVSVQRVAMTSLLKLKAEPDNSEDEDTGLESIPSVDEIWPRDLIDAVREVFKLSESATVREGAADAVRRFQVVEEGLVKQLSESSTKDSDAWVRRSCVRAIGPLITDNVTLGALLDATRDNYAIVRSMAVASLGKLSSSHWPFDKPRETSDAITQIEQTVAARLGDEEGFVRISALKSLGSLGQKTYFKSVGRIPQSQAAKISIRENLKKEDPDVRLAAAKTLGAIHQSDEDIQVLLGALADGNIDVAEEAARSLRNIDFFSHDVSQSMGLKPITVFDLTTPEAKRRTTTSELKTIKFRCEAINAMLGSLSDSRSSELQLETLKSLSKTAASAGATLKAIQDGEMPQDLPFISAALKAVEDCAPSVEKAGPVFTLHLTDSDARFRAVAAEAVGKLELRNSTVLAGLNRLNSDQDKDVRRSALTALPNVIERDDLDISKRTVTTLLAGTVDSDSDVRLAAVESIVQMRAADALGTVFRSSHSDLRKAAISGFRTLKTPPSEVETVLRAALKDGDRAVRLETLYYLNDCGLSGRDLLRDLLPLLDDSNLEIRYWAAQLFGYFKADSSFAVPHLSKLLTDDSLVRNAAIESLGWIGPQAGPAVPTLISLLSDQVSSNYAKKALEQIGDSAVPALLNSHDETTTQIVQEIVATINAENEDRTFRVELKDGTEQNIDLRSTIVIAVATWCPFSKRLREFLIRDDVRPYFTGINFQFLLEDETSIVMQKVTQELNAENLSQEETNKDLEMVKQRLARRGYFDDSFLNELPGKQGQLTTFAEINVCRFPTVLNSSVKITSPKEITEQSWLLAGPWTHSDWYHRHVHMPSSMEFELSSISGSIFGI